MNHTTKTKTTNIILRTLLVLLLCISSLQLYADNYVYVCTGEGSKKYHYSEESPWMNSNCHGDKLKIKESETKRIKNMLDFVNSAPRSTPPHIVLRQIPLIIHRNYL